MHRWKILVVDDQPEITNNLQKQIRRKGYDVQIAQNCTEAKFMIDHYEFDIAILDIVLPDGNGIDLYRTLRDKNKNIYTIMITGNATIENTITALNEGVNSFLIKPFSDEQLTGSLMQASKTLQLEFENRELFQKIESNRKFYENLLDSTSEAIMVIDLDFRIQFCNQAAQKILKIDCSELNEQLLNQYIDDGYKVLSHIYQKLVLGKPIVGYRVGIKTPDEKSMDVHLSADFLHDKYKGIQGLIINLSNPLSHDEVLNRILRKEKLATIINLANILGHEIRNPINILYGRLQLLAEEIKDNSFDHAYQSIRRQIDRLLSITELLGKFNFTREDSIPESFSIRDVLDAIISDKEKQLKTKEIHVNASLTEQNHLVEGNAGQFSDAFHYLMDAIIEFTPRNKKIDIIGKPIRNHSEPPWYELQFLIPDVKISPQQLFDPHQSIDMKANGLIGLGMTIMYTIFTNYGAKIESTVQDDNNTLIRIQFPLEMSRSEQIFEGNKIQ